MREIKFRAWDRVEKKMIYDALEIKNIGLGEGSVVADEETQKGNELDWMQFTGLLSKDGKEIYESDIVKNAFSDVHIIRFGFGGEGEPADFVGGYLGWCMGDENKETTGFTHGREMEIIGNIYENPELLTS